MAGTGDDHDDVRGDVRGQIREFLTTRRARISPEQAGLPVYGGARRRVSGLRREEVASLANISSEYYTRLERGTATGVSESVIDGITHALQLDGAERAHLVDLLRTAGPVPPRRRPTRQQVRPTVQRVLDSMIATPAFVLNGRLDILGANALGVALFAPIYADPIRPANNARFTPRGACTSTSFRPTGAETTRLNGWLSSVRARSVIAVIPTGPAGWSSPTRPAICSASSVATVSAPPPNRTTHG